MTLLSQQKKVRCSGIVGYYGAEYPVGAKVYLNGENVGTTPYDTEIRRSSEVQQRLSYKKKVTRS